MWDAIAQYEQNMKLGKMK